MWRFRCHSFGVFFRDLCHIHVLTCCVASQWGARVCSDLHDNPPTWTLALQSGNDSSIHHHCRQQNGCLFTSSCVFISPAFGRTLHSERSESCWSKCCTLLSCSLSVEPWRASYVSGSLRVSDGPGSSLESSKNTLYTSSLCLTGLAKQLSRSQSQSNYLLSFSSLWSDCCVYNEEMLIRNISFSFPSIQFYKITPVLRWKWNKYLTHTRVYCVQA